MAPRARRQGEPRRAAASPCDGSRCSRARSSTWRCPTCGPRSASSRSTRSASDRRAALAASIAGACRYGRAVSPREMRPVDLVVCGSVGVGRDGARLGKGGGYCDLEYGLLREEGKVRESTPILTTVHPLQILDRAHPDAAARPAGRLPGHAVGGGRHASGASASARHLLGPAAHAQDQRHSRCCASASSAA